MTIERVCAACFDDSDLKDWIKGIGGPKGCDACNRRDSPTHDFDEVCDRIEECLQRYWGFAVEQLPYESAEGGYQGKTWHTWEILFDEEGLQLPRDRTGDLAEAIVHALPDELWCEYDWLSIDEDVALGLSWDRFCEIVKHERRFFFHDLGGNDDDRDSYSAGSLLAKIGKLCDDLGLIEVLPKSTKLWRARSDIKKGARAAIGDFGPPPKGKATQSNRMNPPGIPMMYTASTAALATKETRARSARVGLWQTLCGARILNLQKLRPVPGTFADSDRYTTLGMRFLHRFADDIMRPVARDNRVHIDYLPSQVVTEYLRDFQFAGGRLDGIAYPSGFDRRGWNLALFANAGALSLTHSNPTSTAQPWLRFLGSRRLEIK